MMTGKTGATPLYIALGSNIGDREYWLMEAVRQLNQLHGVRVTALSHIYETAPVGYTDQGPFLNMVAALTSERTVHELFQEMMAIESRLGRKRDIHWGPRTIDLDLLMIDNLTQQIHEPELIVPHPRMLERAFVLIPLLDVLEPHHPDYVKLSAITEGLPDKEGVERWKQVQLPNA